MGLWMIQSVRKELENKYSFAELCAIASRRSDFPSRVDVNDPVFLAPDSMIRAIREMCAKTGHPVPETPDELAAVVYEKRQLQRAWKSEALRAVIIIPSVSWAVVPMRSI